MSTLSAEPVAFRCSRCFNENCATSNEVGQTQICKDCGLELVVPEATPERIQRGHEFLEKFSNHTAQTTTAVPIATDAIPQVELTDAEIFKLARQEARANSGPDAFVCTRLQRFLAHIVDGIVLSIMFGIGAVAMLFFVDKQSETIDPLAFVAFLTFPAMLCIVQWCMTAMDGRTIGKYCLNIKIVNLKNESPGFFQGVLLRKWLIFALNMVPFFGLLDAFFIFGNESKRCIHDYIAGTFVVDAD